MNRRGKSGMPGFHYGTGSRTPGVSFSFRTATAASLLATVLLAVDVPAQSTEAAERAAASITIQSIDQHVQRLAHDSMLGRETTTPQIEKAAKYLAAQLQRFGITPGGEAGTYLQRYVLDRVQPVLDRMRVVASEASAQSWTYGDDFILPYNDWPDGSYSGEAVFLSGRLSGSADFDTTSLRGRVLIISGLLDPRAYLRVSAWRPAALLAVVPVSKEAMLRHAARQGRPQTRDPRLAGGFPVALFRHDALAPWLARYGIDLSAPGEPDETDRNALRAVPIPKVMIELELRATLVERCQPPNVVGILPGRDPELRDEYIVLSAHFDHIGVGPPVDGDSVFNGADDNASGTAAVLEVAGAFARLGQRPRRSILFVLVSGEERLAWGSEYFLDHPPVAVSAMVANLNADMVGRNAKDTLIVVGRRDSDLGLVVDRVLASRPELKLAAIDNPWPDEDPYAFSDHVNFIKKGIPFLYFFSGMHNDYHGLGDEPDKIDAEKLSRVARLIFYTGLAIANADTRPRWDKDRYGEIVGRYR